MTFCEAKLDPTLLRPFLPRLVPLLMRNMVRARGGRSPKSAAGPQYAGVAGGRQCVLREHPAPMSTLACSAHAAARACRVRGAQVFEEHDEEVLEAEAEEGAASCERESEVRPGAHHKAKVHAPATEGGAGDDGEEEDDSDEDDEVRGRGRRRRGWGGRGRRRHG